MSYPLRSTIRCKLLKEDTKFTCFCGDQAKLFIEVNAGAMKRDHGSYMVCHDIFCLTNAMGITIAVTAK